ncbi:MAG: hypothetical protein PHC28_04780 [Flavobacterium sp.]|uniref:hypothetical protein n=1 Tax=Flavobacterium sp. TaxID=239 RepID=UPI002633584C|nr:hypothetical protein [Flavobacterium sp.]MDD5149780.1 hypothetical protein [Flavobacterium sp.]
MGGRALSCGSVRIDKLTYEKVCESVLTELKMKYPTGIFKIAEILPDKETFGDLDIIYSNDSKIDTSKLSWIQSDGSNYTPKFPYINSDITSFDYLLDNGEIFQIDLVKIPIECLSFAVQYFSYGDCGNIIGRAYKYAGFKLTFEGLKYKYLSKYTSKLLTLTVNWQEALDFLEYPVYQEYEFKDILSVFDYCFSTPYANTDIYQIENSNHVDRIRNKKRPMFMAMQQYINDNPNCTADYRLDIDIHRTNFLEKAFNQFPNFKIEYDNCVKIDINEQLYREKFNGNIVRLITGYEGKELSVFIQNFIAYFTLLGIDFKKFIITCDDLKDKIKEYQLYYIHYNLGN